MLHSFEFDGAFVVSEPSCSEWSPQPSQVQSSGCNGVLSCDLPRVQSARSRHRAGSQRLSMVLLWMALLAELDMVDKPNPASIGDNLETNVGDIAGMGAVSLDRSLKLHAWCWFLIRHPEL